MDTIKIEIEFVDSSEEEVITMKVREVDEELLKCINRLKLKDDIVFGTKDNEQFRVPLNEVYYFEAVENKVFMYTRSDVYEIKEKLYNIEKKYESLDFVRVSKSAIVNIEMIESISPEFSGRFELKLINNERVLVSRSYVKVLKNKLGMES